MPSLSSILRDYAVPFGAQTAASLFGRRGVSNAQRRLTGGLTRASDLIRNFGAQQSQALQPFIQAGTGALPRLQAPTPRFERNPDFSFGTADFEADPGYAFRQTEGEKAINRAGNAMGTRFSGATLKDLSRFNQGLASDEYSRAFQRAKDVFGENYSRAEGTFRANEEDEYRRARDLAEIGLTGTGQDILNQRFTADQLADLETELAQAEADGDIGRANLITDAIQEGIGTVTGNQLLSRIFGPAAGAGAGAGAAATGAWLAGGGTLPSLAAIQGGAVPLLPSAGVAGFGGGAGAGAGAGGGGGLGSTLAALATNPITVAAAAAVGGALVAKKLIGRGRRTANQITGQGGLQRNFEEDLARIDSDPSFTDANQKWQAKQLLYAQFKQDILGFAQGGSQQRRVASNAFDTISPLFQDANPLR